MEASDEIKQTIEVFFAKRKFPTREICDQIALAMSQGISVRCVDTPGMKSYTVVVTTTNGEKEIVSFRDEGSGLYSGAIPLAREIHNGLVPKPQCHDIVRDSDPPLLIYTMPYIPGVAASKVLCNQADMTPEDEAKHIHYVQHLARFFGRGWNQAVTYSATSRRQFVRADKILLVRIHKLRNKKRYPNPVNWTVISSLEAHAEKRFEGHRRAVTHGDLVPNNILVDESTFAITGIVDWSHAVVWPFGFDMYAVFLALGYVDDTGWHYYKCRARLQESFWNEFFAVTAIEEGARQAVLQEIEIAAAFGAILRFAYRYNSDGTASPIEEKSVYLSCWYADFYENDQGMARTGPRELVHSGVKEFFSK